MQDKLKKIKDDALKELKELKDSEALVTSCREDKNGEGVLSCIWNEVTFDMKMKGSAETRAYAEQQKLIGQWINFSYQELTEAGKPQFPVGNYVRDCDEDGKPLM